MRPLFNWERRLQDLETRLANQQRFGSVTDVKFDKELKRWYVKMEDGEGEGHTFKSDWLPWRSFSHGAITVSMPPRKGQRVAYTALNGQPELAVVEPFHYGPDDPSPHDKEDEYVIEIHDPKNKSNKDTTLRIHKTKDNQTVTLGKSEVTIRKDIVDTIVDEQKVTVTPEVSVLSNPKGKVELAKSGHITSQNQKAKSEITPEGKIESVNDAGSKVIQMANGMLRLNV